MIFMDLVVGCPIILLRDFAAMIARTVSRMVAPGAKDKLISSLSCKIKLALNADHRFIN